MIFGSLHRSFLSFTIALLSVLPASAATWFPLGPYGGDARSISADPQDSRHLFLGTETGWVYESRDGGSKWNRVAQIQKRHDLVIDHILVDAKNPRRLLVGAFAIDRPDGGLFVSEDAGRTWYVQAEMRGQSIRSMTRSSSNAEELVAGTLLGVFRSQDGGRHWQMISPPDSQEIHEVESVAIDPVDPNIIYAGTWHLPWKTSDGGAHWENIKQGIIDDSDVFSIIVDPVQPKTVYASACSGIYKSNNAAAQFRKVQGIPSSARRTRKLMQDPQHLETVFAGTTEGLYRTFDGGSQWTRTTPADVIVNDVYVDPSDSKHVLLATDRGGVLRSEDGGDTFEPSNTGFAARQVTSYAADAQNGSTIYVGIVNDKETGGVFQSLEGGLNWQQQSSGLSGRDVFSLASTSDGVLLAGTGHGVFRLEAGHWVDSSEIMPLSVGVRQPAPKLEHTPRVQVTSAQPNHQKAGAGVHGKPPVAKRVTGRKPASKRPAAPQRVSTKKGAARKPLMPVRVAKPVAVPAVSSPAVPQPTSAERLDAAIYALSVNGDRVLAGTSAGLMRSDAAARSWSSVPSLQMPEVRFLAESRTILLAGGTKHLALSLDGGSTWNPVALPPDLTQIAALAVDDQRNLWVGGREGVYYSTDYGLTWKSLRNLFLTEVDSVYFDRPGHRVLVTSSNSTVAFAANLPDYKVSFWETGWPLRFVRPVGDHLVGATLFDGVVVQPRMVDSGAGQFKGTARQ